MNPILLTLPIIIPLIFGLLILIIPERLKGLKEAIVLLATLTTLILAILLFNQKLELVVPWFGYGLAFALRLFQFSAFILLAMAAFIFLIALYTTSFLAGRSNAKPFYAYLLFTLSFASGAVLANNLILLLFFWEGLLLTLFGMIFIGQKEAYKTAIKAFIIVGITDLCMLFGIALTGHLAGTFTISNISLPLNSLSALAFILLLIGALAKAGCMPFHSWIPDAAMDAPLPVMALLPGAMEKLVGIYFLTRISLDLFQLNPGHWLSPLLMIIGALTILFAVMMALIQKDYKKLLSYHAISQVGYMVLGIGTAVPVGVVGGLFHMINNAVYKSCLFLTGGAVEKQTGTTDLSKLGGIGYRMPITYLCFIIAAISISGVPPFNGFFSKELVYDGALERGWIFYLAAVVGSFFTAASFLKLGHAAFLGKISEENKKVKEASLAMLLPMLILATVCVVFGLFNALPLGHFIQPILGEHRLEGHSFAGWPSNWGLVLITVLVLLGALLNHYYGVKRTGKGIGAADHIHYAPVLSGLYDRAEKKYFDPYELGIKLVQGLSKLLWWLDRAVDWIYEKLVVSITYTFSGILSWMQNGNFSNYVLWSLIGTLLIMWYSLR